MPASQPWGGGAGPNSSGQAGGQAGPGSVLGQVGWPALSLPGEGLEALGRCLVGRGRGLRRGLHIGEGGGAAIAGRGPHRGLQHLHGVVPLAAGAGDCVERCAWTRQRAGQRRRVLPGCFGWPCFGFVILRDRRGFLVAFLATLFPPPQVSGPDAHLGVRVRAPHLPAAPEPPRPTEPARTEMFCVCAVQCGSHSPQVAGATKEPRTIAIETATCGCCPSLWMAQPQSFLYLWL